MNEQGTYLPTVRRKARRPDGVFHLAPAWRLLRFGNSARAAGNRCTVACRDEATRLLAGRPEPRLPSTDSFVPRTQTHRSQLPPDDEADISRNRAGRPVRRPRFGNSIDIQACRKREGLLLRQQPGQGPEDRILLRRTTHPQFATVQQRPCANKLPRSNPEVHSMSISRSRAQSARLSLMGRRSARGTLSSPAMTSATTPSASTTR